MTQCPCTQRHRTRRIVVVPSVERLAVAASESILTDDESMPLFNASAIRMRWTYGFKKPQLTTEALFMGKMDKVLNVVEWDRTFSTCYIATLIMCPYFRIEKEAMRQCLSSVGWSCVRCVRGLYAIRNIKPLKGANMSPLLTEAEMKEREKSQKTRDVAIHSVAGVDTAKQEQNKTVATMLAY